MRTLSRDDVDAMERASAAELRRVAEDHARAPGRLHLDPSALMEVLALQVVLPFLVAVTSTLAADRLTALKLKRQSRAELRRSLAELEGQPLRAPAQAELEACVRLVEEVLVPMGCQPEDARRIVDGLRRRLEVQSGGTDEASQSVQKKEAGSAGRPG